MKQTAASQLKMITKGADQVIGEEELKMKLERSSQTGIPLTIKLGLDPSAPDIHLGHAVVLRKIKQMQDMGHQAVIIIGDFTGKIGDPTGKAKGRAALSEAQVRANAQTYQEQIFKILDPDKTSVRFNSEWLGQLKMDEIIRLAATTTVARILERDDFQNRYCSNTPIGLHEFFYPILQAYDSVYLKADIELGGTDQTFNILMGRSLQKGLGQESQAAIFMPILEGLDGIEKMSKSLHNYIGVEEEAKVMFKKVMEVPDGLILRYYELATDEHPDQIAGIKEALEKGANPRDIKLGLAETITRLYHSEEEVVLAKQYYHTAFTQKKIPDQIPELVIDLEQDRLIDIIPLLVKEQKVSSGSEFRRILKQGGVRINEEKIDDKDMEYVMIHGDVLKIGKKTFIKIIK